LRLGLVNEEQLAQAEQKRQQLKATDKGPTTLGHVLVNMGLITEKDRVRCLAEQWGVPFVDLSDYEFEPEILKLISQEVARKLKATPMCRKNGKLTVAMKNPLDIFAIDEIRLITGIEVEPVVVTEEDLINAINRAYRTESSITQVVQAVMNDIEAGDIDFTAGGTDGDEDDISIEQLRELSEEAPVIRLANLIVTRAVADKASDIHIEPGRESVRVRFRIDGILHEALAVPKKIQASLISRLKIMADMDIAEKRAPQDGRISAVLDGRQIDFRVSTLPSVNGEKVVLRILDRVVFASA